MRPSTVVAEKIDEVRVIIARYPVTNPRIFGSAARGDDTDSSDVDVLVEPTATTTLLDLARLKVELEKLLGVRVDVATPNALTEDIARNMADDLRPL
jgi:predicted nucleotidyltransferase